MYCVSIVAQLLQMHSKAAYASAAFRHMASQCHNQGADEHHVKVRGLAAACSCSCVTGQGWCRAKQQRQLTAQASCSCWPAQSQGEGCPAQALGDVQQSCTRGSRTNGPRVARGAPALGYSCGDHSSTQAGAAKLQASRDWKPLLALKAGELDTGCGSGKLLGSSLLLLKLALLLG